MTKRNSFLSLLLFFGMTLSLSACGGSNGDAAPADTSSGSVNTEAAGSEDAVTSDGDVSETAGETTGGGTLKVAATNSFTGASAINTANPYRAYTFNQVYETLVTYNGGEYDGVLAESWEDLGNGVWQIKLFDGIVDLLGNPFTSSDVKFVMNGQKDAGLDVGVYYEKDAVEVIDDTTFKLTLTTDSVGVFYTVASKMLMCTEKSYNDSGDGLATMPIGTGPYTCEKYVEGSSCTLAKRDDYWKTGDLPACSVANFDTIEVSYVTESTQMAIAIQSGTVQFAGQVNMSISADVDAVENVTANYVSNGTYNGLSFNMSGREVSTNKALREAICYAIDTQGLIDGVYSGHADKMTTYGMATASDFDFSWTTPISYNGETAKEKLAEAGLASGATVSLMANNVGEDSQLAELIQGYLAMAGITCEIDYVDPATQEARIAEGDWDITLIGGMGVLDMSIFWGNLYGKQSNGMSRYFHSDSALYDVYDEYTKTGGQIAENLQKLYEYESENITWFPLFNKQVLYAIDNTYSEVFLNDAFMSMPFLGTLK